MAAGAIPRPHLDEELALWRSGYRLIAGADEVGVGAIAGPVVAAAVILPLEDPDTLLATLREVRDSKQLWGVNATRRDEKRVALEEVIASTALCYAVAVVDVAAVEELGGGTERAAKVALRQAIEALSPPAEYVLLDGGDALDGLGLPCTAVPKGPGQPYTSCLSIAAASNLAKMARERLMNELALRYPDYHFAMHKGYPTRTKDGQGHLDILEHLGPLPGIHHVGNKLIRQLRAPATHG